MGIKRESNIKLKSRVKAKDIETEIQTVIKEKKNPFVESFSIDKTDKTPVFSPSFNLDPNNKEWEFGGLFYPLDTAMNKPTFDRFLQVFKEFDDTYTYPFNIKGFMVVIEKNEEDGLPSFKVSDKKGNVLVNVDFEYGRDEDLDEGEDGMNVSIQITPVIRKAPDKEKQRFLDNHNAFINWLLNS